MGGRRPAYVALVVATLCWGSLPAVSKQVLPFVGGPLVALDRTVICAIALASLCTIRDRGTWRLRKELRQRPWWLFLFGMSSFFGSSLLLMLALGLLPASITTILNNLGPLWLALGMTALGRSRRPGLLLAGSLLAFSGVLLVLVTHRSGVSVGGSLNWLGVALALGSSVISVAQPLIARHLMPGHDAMAVTSVSAALAVGPLLVVVLLTGGLTPLIVAPISAKLLLLYVGVFATSLSFACYNFALTRIPAVQASNLMYMTPIIAVAMAVVILHEPANWGLVAGLGATILGILLAHRGASPIEIRRRPRPTAIMAEQRS